MDHDKLFDFLRADMEWWGIPGMSYGLVQDGKLLTKGACGYRDVEAQLPATPETLYGCASCSKSFTSCLLGMLVDEGLLDYDVPIRKYIPDFALYDPFASEQVTLRDMLAHRTGLAGHDGMWPDPGLTKRELMLRLRHIKPNAPFRTRTQYSNTIYSFLGHVAEAVTGDTWENLIRRRIYEPLGMKSSMLSAHEMYAQPNHAQGYWNWEDGRGPARLDPWEMDVSGPAAGVISNVDDMLKWITFHINEGVFEGKRLVSEKTMRQMHGQQAPMNLFPWRFPEADSVGSYGMAWFITYFRGRKFVWHIGEIEGFCTLEGFLPDQKTGVFLAMNIHKPLNLPILFSTCYTVFDKLLGEPAVDWAARFHQWRGKYGLLYYHWNVDLFEGMPGPVSGTSPSHPLDDYTGCFHDPGYGTLRVEKEGDELKLRLRDMTVRMEHWHYDVFKARRIKEDTIVVTAPMSYFIDPFSGKIDGFSLQMEPAVEPVVFRRVRPS